jgi:hypothetical protein
MGFIIIGDAILCAVVALFSSNPGAIGLEQDASGARLGVMAAGIVVFLIVNLPG